MRDSIAALLRNMRSLDQLKRLFWQELSYDRVDRPLPSRDWSAEEKALLADDPMILAEHGDFKILFFHMPAELNRAAERTLINRIMQSMPYALFVFANVHYDHWHFVNVKYERDARRRRVFRRITVVAGSDQLRTASDRLAMLNLETVSRDLFGIPALAIQSRHDQAFDVEAVTAEFFRAYRLLFERVEKTITALPEEQRRLFTQKLFNRLLFLVFLERKGWLVFQGRTDYIRALWEDYVHTGTSSGESNFYWNRLNVLFFSGLNNPLDLSMLPDRFPTTEIGSVPYLNGGLFEQDDDDANRNIHIPDHLFQEAIEELFYRFNFTIAESTPLDIEVAVDPEMLGKIFEELVTGRHESGSYYTPKPVVSFMCREGLKGFLRANTHEDQAAIAHFVDDYDSTRLHDPEKVLDALRRVTVCDPACGSGAYLLGMLQELLLLRDSLFKTRSVGARSVYDRKLEIIQRSIYGVDKEPFAINIAQLRLWLSLIVEYERKHPNDEIPTLPNLDYKLEVGDSLLGPDPSNDSQRSLDRTIVDQYVHAKAAYLQAHGAEKQRLHNEIEDLKRSIRSWSQVSVHTDAFDWAVEFAEVFIDGGFDIMLANPPYVRQELIKDIKPTLKAVFPETYTGTADLYTYFYARAVQALRSAGTLVFISSNKWMRSDYGKNLRFLLMNHMQLDMLIDFGDLPVFGAIAYPVIVVARKQHTLDNHVQVLTPKNLERLDDLSAHLSDEAILLPATSFGSGGWSFGDLATQQRRETMRIGSKTLQEYVHGKIYRGILTGLNEVFVINAATRAALIVENPNSSDLIKPFLRGRDIKRWRANPADLWLIFTRRGVDIERYPAILSYLLEYRKALEPRPRSWTSQQTWSGRKAGSYKWYEIQDEIAYYQSFELPKIIIPAIVNDAQFWLDTDKYYSNDKTSIIQTDDRYLLGIMNSQPAFQFLKDIAASRQGGFYEMKPMYIKQLPIPNASQTDKNSIAELVQQCLDKAGVGCELEEAEINARAATLYGLKNEIT